MSAPQSHLFDGAPRLHYLEWNPRAASTIILLHGNSANAWWWEPLASQMPPEFRLLALDLRGHGDSEWVKPPAYTPTDYASDLARFVRHHRSGGERPLILGHSMGGLCVLAFARAHSHETLGVVAIDVAVTSGEARNRYLRRLKSLPTVTYPDLETAKARFRLMPNEGGIPEAVIRSIAEKSFARTEDGRWTLKFDRESFFGSDGIDVLDTVAAIECPTLLVRAGRSRIMTADAARRARDSNPHAQLVTISLAHHHVLLEKPAALAKVITDFATKLR